MSLAAAQPGKWNLQCIRPWRMQETQNHLALIIVFQMQVTRKATYVHCYLHVGLTARGEKFSPKNAPFGHETNQPNA